VILVESIPLVWLLRRSTPIPDCAILYVSNACLECLHGGRPSLCRRRLAWKIANAMIPISDTMIVEDDDELDEREAKRAARRKRAAPKAVGPYGRSGSLADDGHGLSPDP